MKEMEGLQVSKKGQFVSTASYARIYLNPFPKLNSSHCPRDISG